MIAKSLALAVAWVDAVTVSQPQNRMFQHEQHRLRQANRSASVRADVERAIAVSRSHEERTRRLQNQQQQQQQQQGRALTPANRWLTPAHRPLTPANRALTPAQQIEIARERSIQMARDAAGDAADAGLMALPIGVGLSGAVPPELLQSGLHHGRGGAQVAVSGGQSGELHGGGQSPSVLSQGNVFSPLHEPVDEDNAEAERDLEGSDDVLAKRLIDFCKRSLLNRATRLVNSRGGAIVVRSNVDDESIADLTYREDETDLSAVDYVIRHQHEGLTRRLLRLGAKIDKDRFSSEEWAWLENLFASDGKVDCKLKECSICFDYGHKKSPQFVSPFRCKHYVCVQCRDELQKASINYRCPECNESTVATAEDQQSEDSDSDASVGVDDEIVRRSQRVGGSQNDGGGGCVIC